MRAFRIGVSYVAVLAMAVLVGCDSEQEEVPSDESPTETTIPTEAATLPPAPPPDAGAPVTPSAEELAAFRVCPHPDAVSRLAYEPVLVRDIEIVIPGYMTRSAALTAPGDEHGGIIH
jgi:hypothetical protein